MVRLRYGGGGERERKRMISHPSLSQMSGYTPGYGTVPGWTSGLPWTYYLLDGGSRQHAVYEGRYLMTDVSSECDTGAVLYWVPAEYLIHGTGDVPYLSLLPNGDKRYRIQDNLGSTRVVFDGSGNLYQWTSYEPFGKTVPGGGGNDRLSFIGKEKDDESDLGDFGARKYDEEIGRFLSTDPLWEEQRPQNVFHYSDNNPILLKDPNGLCPLCLAALMVFAYQAFVEPTIVVAPTQNPGLDKRLIEQEKKDQQTAGQVIDAVAPIGGIVKGGLKAGTRALVKEAVEEGAEQVTKKGAEQVTKKATKETTKQSTKESQKTARKKAMQEFEKNNKEHTKNASGSSKGKHEKGQAAKRKVYNDKKRSKDGWQQNPNRKK